MYIRVRQNVWVRARSKAISPVLKLWQRACVPPQPTVIIDDIMSLPKCPECDSTDLTPISDPVLAKKNLDAPIVAYRCSNQHLFPSPDPVRMNPSPKPKGMYLP